MSDVKLPIALYEALKDGNAKWQALKALVVDADFFSTLNRRLDPVREVKGNIKMGELLQTAIQEAITRAEQSVKKEGGNG